ncbi:SDR family NAD(P)-dependent oxidoreductase [Frankia sp. CNm7]|uniref:SDR family NAD(P)-dependent oxidoreductase n=1 Tax=Frankia nepalensis TaxID=1836974 RepID=A0A937RH29_9ACTN|nr:SDR family NAD(P)-dependent oxidoreductase [Frankia nepalensis]MBL7499171.1 SDR family NAD(P)-dependent oxidoreductase [Frankia nepalensis]MBL7511011.1 SDR family NAD(P)-dependent oxidoreductase [Frankia nepalensis]MBL7520521.1 SDR family NAD(P)-dependent oxidoreductase [Frankia nepalensis]MBL7632091.1 SDR family NAD(P)-dependent oxidoreductase [Frankia nepalensis]
MDLQGRSAVVTGGAGGLGSATARRLVEAGMHTVVFDRDVDRAAELAKELGDNATAVSGDVLSDDDVALAIDAARAAGPFSLLVNVAGGGAGGGRLVARDGTPHDKNAFIKTLEMNAVTTFNMTRLAAAAMASNEPDEHGQRGVVVNTASIAGLEGRTGQVGYGSAKAAILGMTLPMARDLAVIGVRVCAVAPGTMGTPIMYTLRDELRAELTKGIVFPPRFGRPEEFALLVESIARNPYLNGENIRLDGALRFAP